ncbi:hypothetical protein BGX28_003746, partial [Mortierella sp. GBA30]
MEDVILASGTVHSDDQAAITTPEELLHTGVDDSRTPQLVTLDVTQPANTSAQTVPPVAEDMAMEVDSDVTDLVNDEDDLFELYDMELAEEDLTDARTTAAKYETKLSGMKKVQDSRSLKIKELKSIIGAYADIRAESSNASFSDADDKHRLKDINSASRTSNGGNGTYQYLNISEVLRCS